MSETVDILICTIDDGIKDVPSCLMDFNPSINYIVSWQQTDGHSNDECPIELTERKDVAVSRLRGRGLSRNRNNAISKSKSEICIIADDDCRYTYDRIKRLMELYESNSDTDAIVMKSIGPDGKLLRNYPDKSFNLKNPPKGYYPISIDITFRRKNVCDIKFDERFGLGSEKMNSGEEGAWIESLLRHNKKVEYFPFPLAQTVDNPKSGKEIYKDAVKLFSNGSLLYYVYGIMAIPRSIKYSLSTALEGKGNAFFIFRNQMRGIFYMMKEGRNL